jgi:hypothetical protein
MRCPECGHPVDAHHELGCFDFANDNIMSGPTIPCPCKLTGGEAFVAFSEAGEA